MTIAIRVVPLVRSDWNVTSVDTSFVRQTAAVLLVPAPAPALPVLAGAAVAVFEVAVAGPTVIEVAGAGPVVAQAAPVQSTVAAIAGTARNK
jgi:hypothetical protein